MQIRCSIQMGEDSRKLVLVSQDTETLEHMALKLAAYLLFYNENPIVGIKSDHPAIGHQEFQPDLLCLNEAGEIKIWIECGNVATHKLDKLIRRNRQARIVVLKSTLHEAQNLRRAFEKNDIKHSNRVEVLTFPEGFGEDWIKAMAETVEVFGEVSEHSFNLVANLTPFSFNFVKV